MNENLYWSQTIFLRMTDTAYSLEVSVAPVELLRSHLETAPVIVDKTTAPLNAAVTAPAKIVKKYKLQQNTLSFQKRNYRASEKNRRLSVIFREEAFCQSKFRRYNS